MVWGGCSCDHAAGASTKLAASSSAMIHLFMSASRLLQVTLDHLRSGEKRESRQQAPAGRGENPQERVGSISVFREKIMGGRPSDHDPTGTPCSSRLSALRSPPY